LMLAASAADWLRVAAKMTTIAVRRCETSMALSRALLARRANDTPLSAINSAGASGRRRIHRLEVLGGTRQRPRHRRGVVLGRREAPRRRLRSTFRGLPLI
jgi:hypothetical protein